METPSIQEEINYFSFNQEQSYIDLKFVVVYQLEQTMVARYFLSILSHFYILMVIFCNL